MVTTWAVLWVWVIATPAKAGMEVRVTGVRKLSPEMVLFV
jgi:hypothetical protein